MFFYEKDKDEIKLINSWEDVNSLDEEARKIFTAYIRMKEKEIEIYGVDEDDIAFASSPLGKLIAENPQMIIDNIDWGD